MTSRCAAAILIMFLAGCTADRAPSPTTLLPGGPTITSPNGADPFNLSKKGFVHRYPLPTGTNPNRLATGSDKNVWFTEGAPKIGMITPGGAIAEHPIPSGNRGFDIAAGRAGRLWFTEDTTNAIGKITTAGRITEYPLPSGSCSYGIGMGPNGDMWFTDPCSNKIGEVTPTGAVTEYPIPTSNADPRDIVTGPDGNLWFVETNSSQVGKITTSGTITEYASATNDPPFAIASGPDGDLYASSWFGIWRVTTAGVITQYQSPQLLFRWADIVLGPDKQMWISNAGFASNIQEFNPSTQMFSITIPVDGGQIVGGLTVGADGDVWIADNGGNNIVVYEEKLTTVGIRLNGELSFTDPNYGFELGYAIGGRSTQTQTIGLDMGESIEFKNVDTIPHSAALLGDATSNNAPWPASFDGSTLASPAGTAIGTTGWATGSLIPGSTSPVYETGLPGFYMIGCQYHYNTNEMRTVIVVH